MKRLIMAGLIAGASISAQAQLIITGVIDGPLSGGVPKAVELYAESDIADLSVYGLESANNGKPASAQEFTFPSRELSAGQTIYVASETLGFNTYFGFEPDYSSSAMAINGDDAIVLYHDGIATDVFGEVGVDGSGQAWEYTDGWAYRHSNSTASSMFDADNWQFSSINALDSTSSNASATLAFPLKSYAGSSLPTPLPTATPKPEPKPNLVQISSIQGSGPVAALEGEKVTVEAVVIGDFQNNDSDDLRNLGGFFLQEEIDDEDGDSSTSEALFVYSEQAVELGQIVRVSGSISEFYGSTQMGSVTDLKIINTEDNRQLVRPAVIDLALNNDVVVIDQSELKFQADLEAYENMLVSFAGELQITEQFNLDRFNEIRLVAGARPYQFTQQHTPNAALYEQNLRQQAARSIIYDDGLGIQNADINLLDGFAPYNEASAKRMGDTVNDLSGILNFSFNTWRVRSTENGLNIFSSSQNNNSANPRPVAPAVRGNLKLASFNVLNFFHTLDDGSIPLSGLEPRGADNAEELGRQQAKLVNAIIAIDADVLALLELENEFDATNDGSSAIEMLVNALNTKLGKTTYSYVYPGSRLVGSDAIAAGFIYKPEVVEIAEGSHVAVLDDTSAASLDIFTSRDFSSEPIFDGPSTNRNSIAVTFNQRASNDAFTAVVNHFKSKGGSGSGANADAGDGAGNYNQRRLDAAMALVAWLETYPTGLEEADQVILGDLNSYAQEEPVQYLLDAGFNNVENTDSYSFVYDGQIGTLDYILLNDALFEKFTEAAVWHINADEADALDYNLDYGRNSSYFDESSPTRSSDHDPLYIGLQMLASELSFNAAIQDFSKGVDNGEIMANNRWRFKTKWQLFAYYSMLVHAERAYIAGHTARTCNLLQWARKYADAQKRPKDLIKGPGTATVLADVNMLISQHCE